MKSLHLFAIGLNLALVTWGAFCLSAGISVGAGLMIFGCICGASALQGYRRMLER